MFTNLHTNNTLESKNQRTINNSRNKSSKTKNQKIISNDNSLQSKVGCRFNISDKMLGHGSYGDVYLATDENDNNFAIKCCKIESEGIPNILETSIMSSFYHPHINRAIRIHASDTRLYIIQDVAKMDMSQHTKREKGNYKPNIDELRQWCYNLSQAVETLHNENIIHGDIKSGNVLLYNDNSVKLTDFTLSIKKWSQHEKFKHKSCTCTHRPLECFLGREWNESLDIWSLACTFYEIAYGELLFPFQGILEKDSKSKEAKIRLQQRSINAILDWNLRGPMEQTPYELININQYPIDYLPYILCEDCEKPEMRLFNDLLYKMLVVDPEKRLTIKSVLLHPFFINLSHPIHSHIVRPTNKINNNEKTRVLEYMNRITTNSNNVRLAFNLYSKCNDIVLSEKILATTCVWIASKIVNNKDIDINIPKNQILHGERLICHNLCFRLHDI